MLIGLQSGMVMQRGKDNCCRVWFESDQSISTAACLNDDQKLTVTQEGRHYCLTGLAVGGPYRLQIGDQLLDEIYVGDVWILAGQSNMHGFGRPDQCTLLLANPKIRALYMYGAWGVAAHPIHEPGRAIYGVHHQITPERPVHSTRIVGPGIAIAQRMYELTGVPQGLIACAHGGTSMEQWDPEKSKDGVDGSLYAAMIERFRASGSHIKGMFWYQGCAEANQEKCCHYTARMLAFFASVRNDMGNIPIVQAQIARFSRIGTTIDDPTWQCWSGIQEQQRRLPEKVSRLDTVHTVALELADDIHLEGSSQESLGRSAAESMFCLLHGRLYGCMPGIRLSSIACFPDDTLDRVTTIVLGYDNVHGQLDGGPRPLGYVLSHQMDGDFYRPFQVRVDGRYVYVKVNRPLDEVKSSYLWYGVGHDPACNILDGENRSLPAMGPIAICSQPYFYDELLTK